MYSSLCAPPGKQDPSLIWALCHSTHPLTSLRLSTIGWIRNDKRQRGTRWSHKNFVELLWSDWTSTLECLRSSRTAEKIDLEHPMPWSHAVPTDDTRVCTWCRHVTEIALRSRALYWSDRHVPRTVLYRSCGLEAEPGKNDQKRPNACHRQDRSELVSLSGENVARQTFRLASVLNCGSSGQRWPCLGHLRSSAICCEGY